LISEKKVVVEERNNLIEKFKVIEKELSELSLKYDEVE